jgi:hypothetical protein
MVGEYRTEDNSEWKREQKKTMVELRMGCYNMHEVNIFALHTSEICGSQNFVTLVSSFFALDKRGSGVSE